MFSRVHSSKNAKYSDVIYQHVHKMFRALDKKNPGSRILGNLLRLKTSVEMIRLCKFWWVKKVISASESRIWNTATAGLLEIYTGDVQISPSTAKKKCLFEHIFTRDVNG